MVLRSSGSPGFLLVLEGYHRHWQARVAEGPAAILPANGRYSAIVTPGGERAYVLSYEPPWRAPSLATSLLAAVLVVGGCLKSVR
jgi:hypothetical protein